MIDTAEEDYARGASEVGRSLTGQSVSKAGSQERAGVSWPLFGYRQRIILPRRKEQQEERFPSCLSICSWPGNETPTASANSNFIGPNKTDFTSLDINQDPYRGMI